LLDDCVSEAIDWLDSQITREGLVERSFVIRRSAGPVPGLLWLPPAAASAPPLVMLGHGGSGHKRSERIVSLAQWFAGQAGLAAVAIDGPYHGDRVPAPVPAPVYQARIAAEGMEVVLDRMTADWRAAVAAIGAAGLADTSNLGYLGVSMGTRFGLALSADLGNVLSCAMFGKFGLSQSPAMDAGLLVPERVSTDARRITAPTLFHLQWHDEIFPRQGQLDLFDLLGSPDKQLMGYAGPHAETKPEAIARWRGFIVSHLVTGP
jgi:dienelactone hydrolase